MCQMLCIFTARDFTTNPIYFYIFIFKLREHIEETLHAIFLFFLTIQQWLFISSSSSSFVKHRRDGRNPPP